MPAPAATLPAAPVPHPATLVPGWDELLARLAEVPRENGTAAVQQTAGFLYDALSGTGLEVELVGFTAHPYRLRLAGVLICVGALLYFRCMRRGRHAAALGVALVVPALALLELDLYVPILGWIGAEPQQHVSALVPATQPAQRLLLTAHYDTKTDVLDHVQRAPVEMLALPVVALMILGALAGWAAPRVPRQAARLRGVGSVAGWAAALYGVSSFVTLSAGAFVPARSPGALDNGAACAVLVRLAGELSRQAPLDRTQVEIVLLAAEEIGVQGSWELAESRFATPPALPTFVLNLENLGESTRYAVLSGESYTLRSFEPSPQLVALLDRVHRERRGEPLEIFPLSGGTDARSFLAHGVPAATLVTLPAEGLFTRGLHSARDDRSRIDEQALGESLDFLIDVVRAADAGGLRRGR